MAHVLKFKKEESLDSITLEYTINGVVDETIITSTTEKEISFDAGTWIGVSDYEIADGYEEPVYVKNGSNGNSYNMTDNGYWGYQSSEAPTATYIARATEAKTTTYEYKFENTTGYDLKLYYALSTVSSSSMTITSGKTYTLVCAPGDMVIDCDKSIIDGECLNDLVYWQRTKPSKGTKYTLGDSGDNKISLKKDSGATYTFTNKSYVPSVTYYATIIYDPGEAGDYATNMPADKKNDDSNTPSWNITLSSKTPEWPGYTFVGWLCDGITYQKGASFPVEGSEEKNDSQYTYTLVAQWEKKYASTKYYASIIYNSGDAGNNVTNMPSDQKNLESDVRSWTETLKSKTPEWSGYSFKGWYSADYDQTYQPGDDFEVDGTESGNDYILVALWEKKYASTKYYADIIYEPGVAGENATNMPSDQKNLESDVRSWVIQLRSRTPEWSGYRFIGWYSADYDEIFEESSEFEVDGTESGTEYILVAQWEKIVASKKYYTSIIYDPGIAGDNVTNMPSDQKNLESDIKSWTVQLRSKVPEYDGYSFIGWYSEDYDDTFQPGDDFDVDGTESGSIYILVAQWGPAIYYPYKLRVRIDDVRQSDYDVSDLYNKSSTIKFEECFKTHLSETMYATLYANIYTGYSLSANGLPRTGDSYTFSNHSEVTIYVDFESSGLITITFVHYRGKKQYGSTTTISVTSGATVSGKNTDYHKTDIPCCIFAEASDDVIATSPQTINIYYKYQWDNPPQTGQPWKITAEEWNYLRDFIDDQRVANGGSKSGITNVSRGDDFTFTIYNNMWKAIGKGTEVAQFDPISQALMDELVTNANAMAGL